ncbi:uncharacterized protein LOC131162103 isoform X2 [Malania oleifera]|nr:uncharacterized protein LOC131162103 isoform X2 [Malania oleifera]
MDRLGVRGHDFYNTNGSSDHVAIGVRVPPHKQSRPRRSPKTFKISIGAVVLVLSILLFLSIFVFSFLSRDHKETNSYSNAQDNETKSDLDFLTNVTRTESKVLKFGHGSVAHGRDSRYWDKDDRRRDEDYNEDMLEQTVVSSRDESRDKGHDTKVKNGNEKFSGDDSFKVSDRRGVGLYNEAGRDELKMYEAEYEASLKNVGQSRKEHGNVELRKQKEEADVDDEYDDGLDSHDTQMEDYDDTVHDNRDHSDEGKYFDGDGRKSFDNLHAGTKDRNFADDGKLSKDFPLNSQNPKNVNSNSRFVGSIVGQSTRKFSPEKRLDSKKKTKRRSSCEMKLFNSTAQLVEPLESRKFARFSLQYTEVEEKPDGPEHWEPRFAGHQSLQDREKSFLANDQKINCGFVKGPKGSSSTGFDLAEDDARYISSCHIAVSSCIFGNSDRLRSPTGKAVTRLSRKNVCFVMFMDEITLQTLSSEGQTLDRTGFIGLWKIVVVKNLPYTDMRRVGKIPKLLPHRLFPSARYSIWLDSKLRLQRDPLLILEYFLWRKGYEYAISNHYDRHCLWEEVAQNKKLNKYNHTIIDQQFAFYQADGLKRFNASDPNKLLPSNVPEGSFIVRAHTPMSNLFSCLWFNEVERFTPRDQLSFAYTYQKLRTMNPGKPFHLNMFKDCERRAIAKLFHHRSEEKRNIPQRVAE